MSFLGRVFFIFLFAWAPYAFTMPLKIGEHTFSVRVVSHEKDLAKGLMGVEHLSARSGMLFLFKKGKRPVFWMKDTPLDLDLAYLDRHGRIVQMETLYAHSLTRVSAKRLVYAALEVPRGTFRKLKVRVGDLVECSALKGYEDAKDTH